MGKGRGIRTETVRNQSLWLRLHPNVVAARLFLGLASGWVAVWWNTVQTDRARIGFSVDMTFRLWGAAPGASQGGEMQVYWAPC